ncbi:hypothetical protein Hypma_006240 [Hypsizygus marmoreus]|uniref:Uncharacterized protein n=1 Tax=Hypsizygus marmoreus TaxID=39966 RepID=A0A369JZ81_HYPMA|nr:hypothetical protein Hypma_006240 [Hypsizygus marmoreus]
MNTGLEPPSEPTNFPPDDRVLSPLGSTVGDLSSFRFRPRSVEASETNRSSMSERRSPRLAEHLQSTGVSSAPQPGSSVAQLASLLTDPPLQRPARRSSTPSNAPRPLASSPILSNNSSPMHPLPPVPPATHSQYPPPESVAPPLPQPPLNQWGNHPHTQSNYYGYGGYRHPPQPLQFPTGVPALPTIPTNDALAYYSAPNLHYSGYPLPTQPIHAQSAPPPVAIRLQSDRLVAPFPTHGLHYSGYPLPTFPTPIYNANSQPVVPYYPARSRPQTPLPTSNDAHITFMPPASRTSTPQTRLSSSPVEAVTSPQLQQHAGYNTVNYMVNVPGTDITFQPSLARSSTISPPSPFAPQTPAGQVQSSDSGESAMASTSGGWIFEGPAVSFGRHLGTSPQIPASGNTIVVNMASNSTLNLYYEQRQVGNSSTFCIDETHVLSKFQEKQETAAKP